ncbi:MAG: tetratricopeptide repeat protein, partial [Promethearchaeota archaeon]
MFAQSTEAERKSEETRIVDLAAELDWAGFCYKEAGQYGKALSYYKEVLAVDTELDRKGDIAIDWNNIGKVYYAWEQYDKAIEHYNKALDINEELDRKSDIATNLNNIGTVYNTLGKYDKAIGYLTKARSINRGLGRKSNDALIPGKERARTEGVAVDLNKIRSKYKARGHYNKRVEQDNKAMTTKIVRSNLYIISIGIDEYSSNPLEYCVSDVKKATDFLNKQFQADSIIITERQTKSVFGQVYIYTLFNRRANYSSIDSLFRIVSNQAEPEDFFVLFFAGYSYDLGQEDSTYQGIYFAPYIEDEIYQPSEISKEKFKQFANNSISISQLKFSLELIQAKKQLIITEAGPSKNFFKEFTTALIEKDQIIAQLTDKNRIILTTNGLGLDNAYCE